MSKFCANCGATLADDAAFCAACGTQSGAPAQQTQQPTYQQPVTYAKPKIPGRGFGISALVLGIIGLVFAIIDFGNVSTFVGTANAFGSFGSAIGRGYAGQLIGQLTLELIIPALAIIFGICAKKRGYKNKVATSGFVLGIIAAGLVAIAMIMVATV